MPSAVVLVRPHVLTWRRLVQRENSHPCVRPNTALKRQEGTFCNCQQVCHRHRAFDRTCCVTTVVTAIARFVVVKEFGKLFTRGCSFFVKIVLGHFLFFISLSSYFRNFPNRMIWNASQDVYRCVCVTCTCILENTCTVSCTCISEHKNK